MTPRSIWFGVAVIWGLVLCVFVIRNRKGIATWSKNTGGWAKHKARSAYGRVANAADRVMHTERSPEVP